MAQPSTAASEVANTLVLKVDSTVPVQVSNASSSFMEAMANNLPFMITIIIVLCAAGATVWSNLRSIKSNRDADHQNKISEFRHHWLQEVRETASELIETIYKCHTHSFDYKVSNAERDLFPNDSDEFKKISDDIGNNYDLLRVNIAKFHRLHSKLKLFFKKDEPETVELFKLLQVVHDKAVTVDEFTTSDTEVDEIIEALQIVLKSEWDATKDRSWLKVKK